MDSGAAVAVRPPIGREPGGAPFAAPGGVWYSLGSVYEHPHTHSDPTPDV